MLNIFALIIVVNFTLAGIWDIVSHNYARGIFYLLSAALNVVILYMK